MRNSVKPLQEPLQGHQLYYFGSCVYCLMVRAAIWWFKINIPLKDVMRNSQNHAELVSGGGKDQVPCLRIEQENGEVEWLYDSTRIIRYLKSRANA